MWLSLVKGSQQCRFIDSVIKLEMRYASIRRVLLDVVPDQNGNYGVALFFHLTCPPAIKIVRMYDESRNGRDERLSFFAMHGDRYTNWDK